jgi:hypothetical protein
MPKRGRPKGTTGTTWSKSLRDDPDRFALATLLALRTGDGKHSIDAPYAMFLFSPGAQPITLERHVSGPIVASVSYGEPPSPWSNDRGEIRRITDRLLKKLDRFLERPDHDRELGCVLINRFAEANARGHQISFDKFNLFHGNLLLPMTEARTATAEISARVREGTLIATDWC